MLRVLMNTLELPLVRVDSASGTQDRILDVSERLFAIHGISGTSVRHITDQANVNVAAVNYHFGSKENLVRAVINRRFSRLEEARSQAMDVVESRCATENRAPTPAELVEALIDPIFCQSLSGDTGWSDFMRFVSRLSWEPGAEKFSPPESSMRVFDRFDEALKLAIPALAANDGKRGWRIAFMRAATQQTLLTLAAVRAGEKPGAIGFANALDALDVNEVRRELVAFVAAGLSAH